MSRTVRTVEAEKTVSYALNAMTKYDIGSVIVLEGGRPTAIATERDVTRKLSEEGADSLDWPVKRIASKPLLTISPSAEVWEAFTTMLRKKIRRLPVLEDGSLVGIVTERDLLKWVVRVFYEPNVPDDIRELILQKD
jgi:CBS domain-containing protein